MGKLGNLSATAVSRNGRTVKGWTPGTNEVTLSASRKGVAFFFSIRSKGGGITDIKMEIGLADFRQVLSALLRADRRHAMYEMAGALAGELERQTEHDRKVARTARRAVLNAARRAYFQAPKDRNHDERLTRDMVRKLVEQLDKADE